MIQIHAAKSPGAPVEHAPMRQLLRRLRERLRGRPDTEHEMMPNRIVFAGSVILYLGIATWLGSAQARTMLVTTYPAFVAYFGVTFLIFAHIVWKTDVFIIRRLVAMVADFAMISFAAAAGGVATGFFYPFYLWTIFGNGFRFGIPFLYAAMLVGNVGFLCVLVATGTWREHFGLSVALLLCLLMLPLYAGKLIKKISEAKNQAEEANRAKTAFLASVSHELRTPLNAIIGLGDLLRGQICDAEQKDMVQTISNAGRTLLNLINSILDFSRLEAGRMPSNTADVDFFREMFRIETMLAVPARAKSLAFNVHITARTPRMIHGDFSHIEQVLVNLSANAIKFTNKGNVLIATDAVQHEENGRVRLRFEVSDTGIGIAPEARERIFDTFSQADSSILDRYGGTGLGLSICKQLVNLLNGEIGFESEVGKGSTFWFEVDVKVLASEEQRLSPSDQPLMLLTHDVELEQAVCMFGSTVLVADKIANLVDWVSGNDEILNKPTVIIDQRALDQAEVATEIDALRNQAILVAVAETAGLASIDDTIRRNYASSMGMPIVPADLQGGLQIAGLKSERGLEVQDTGAIVPSARRPLSVLVAEDNKTNQIVIAKILERAGHRAVVVDNGELALDALRDGKFDVVLMDVNMPVMNGIEAAKLYRFVSLGGPRIPIIALTADAKSDAWKRCEEAGMDAYATKPIEPTHLLEIIERVASEPFKPEDKVVSDAEDVPPATIDKKSIDMSKLEDLELLGGSDFVADVVSQFSRDSVQLRHRLLIASDREDVQEFREAAHALRSSAANVGATKVFEHCLAVRAITPEQLALNGEQWLQQLEQEITYALVLLGTSTASAVGNDKDARALVRH